MFFVETLGPLMSPELAEQLVQFVKSKVRSQSITRQELYGPVSEFLRANRVSATPDAAIDLLGREGKLTFEAERPALATKFKFAA